MERSYTGYRVVSSIGAKLKFLLLVIKMRLLVNFKFAVRSTGVTEKMPTKEFSK